MWRAPWNIYQDAVREAGAFRGTPREQDAFKHRLASCAVTSENDLAEALLLGWGKDMWDNVTAFQKEGDFLMDVHNNAIGRSLGQKSARCFGDCKDACKQALNNGTLTTGFNQGEPVIPDSLRMPM